MGQGRTQRQTVLSQGVLMGSSADSQEQGKMRDNVETSILFEEGGLDPRS